MVPLATHKLVWTWCCVHPVDEDASRWKKFACITFTFLLSIANLSVVPASVEYVIENVSDNPEAALHALFQITAYIGMIYANINGLFLRHKITAIFTKLTQIYEKNANKDSFYFLEEANNKCEWLWQFYFKYMFALFMNAIVATIQSLIVCYSNYGHFDAQYLYHPFKMVLPWNCETPFGYFMEIVFNNIVGQAYIFTNGMFLVLFIAMCMHHQAFFKMFDHSVRKLEFEDKNRNDKEFLRELIEFHNMVKSFMMESQETYSAFTLVILVCLTISNACMVFELDLQIRSTGPDIFIVLAGLIICASSPFLYCFFGGEATCNYEDMADCVYGCNWQRLPLNSQKYMILMIANMQQPLQYHGFGIVVLNLETFQGMFRKIMSYYMMFKTLTE